MCDSGICHSAFVVFIETFLRNTLFLATTICRHQAHMSRLFPTAPRLRRGPLMCAGLAVFKGSRQPGFESSDRVAVIRGGSPGGRRRSNGFAFGQPAGDWPGPNFSVASWVVPAITRGPLADADGMLDLMNAGRVRPRGDRV